MTEALLTLALNQKSNEWNEPVLDFAVYSTCITIPGFTKMFISYLPKGKCVTGL